MEVREKILPVIDRELCVGCGTCVELCPTGAVELVDGFPVIVRPEDCVYCGECEDLCPLGAIGLPYEVVFGEAA